MGKKIEIKSRRRRKGTGSTAAVSLTLSLPWCVIMEEKWGTAAGQWQIVLMIDTLIKQTHI